MILEIRGGKASAEKRESDLRAGNEILIEEFSKLRETALTMKKGSGPMVELQQLLMKWNSTNTLLAESLKNVEAKDKKLHDQEDQIRGLSDQLGQAKIEQQQAAEQIQRLLTTIKEHTDAASRDEEQLVSIPILCKLCEADHMLQFEERAVHLSNLQEELETRKADHLDCVNELENFRAVHHTMLRELDESKSRLSQAIREGATAKSTIENLSLQLVQMDELRKQVHRVQSLTSSCEKKDGIIVDLQQEVESCKVTTKQLEGYQVDAEKKAIQISELSTRLQAAEEASYEHVALQEALQQELQQYREEIQPLKSAQDQVITLESELHSQYDRIDELNMKIADLGDSHKQLDDVRAQLSHYEYEHGRMEKILQASKEEDGRGLMGLEEEIKAQKDVISELKVKLAEAERVSNDTTAMQALRDEFDEIFGKLNQARHDADIVGKELHSTKAVNVSLQEAVEQLKIQAAASMPASNAEQCPNDDIKKKDAEITALRIELARKGSDSYENREIEEAEREPSFDGDHARQKWHFAESNSLRQETIGHENHLSIAEEKVSKMISERKEPGQKRKRADRSASSLQANTSVTEDSNLITQRGEGIRPKADSAAETSAHDAKGSHSLTEGYPSETDLIPESQPGVNNLRQLVLASSMRETSAGNVVSSSPLSDIGELFDPSDPDHAGNLWQHRVHEHGGGLMGRPSEDHIRAAQRVPDRRDLSLIKTSQDKDSPVQTHNPKGLSQEGRPLSSSYGEPLLFDDIERLGSLSTNHPVDQASGKLSNRSTQDILTSPMSQLPRRLHMARRQGRPVATAMQGSDGKIASVVEHLPHLAKGESPRRLRSSETSSQPSARQPPGEIDENAMNIPPSTPDITMREKHQPNSAIKRKSEVADVQEETRSTEKKRTKRNLTNMEVTTRPRKVSRSLSSSTPASFAPALPSRLRQPSKSSTSTGGTILGKNASAPGLGKQGSKKRRGGSKSEECLIVAIPRGY